MAPTPGHSGMVLQQEHGSVVSLRRSLRQVSLSASTERVENADEVGLDHSAISRPQRKSGQRVRKILMANGRIVHARANRSILDFLDRVHARPGMWVRNNSLRELENMVWGYTECLSMHNIWEDVPQMTTHFLDWLRYRTGWDTCCGWADAIERNSSPGPDALSAFFKFVDEYRRLRPVTLCTVKLGANNTPTGKRIITGPNGRMERPSRVDIVRYSPKPFHFFRFYYKDRVEKSWLLSRNWKIVTTVRFAKQWVQDEFQVNPKLWTDAAES